ncbi:hypothetical protein M430DRAFT_45485 [Amorphotheca resinae ATCC 22711]|uniref:Uncharacterized protein n=1 Tax=Amorphotheca resinae ATCC 22711 TaxID=857342 RepID=A0A2T3AQJ5_AMORE|nr:hypothetical protein M430DRAFT_45485 [Amorphotheca resinae ATCC 22711]PSS08533.1 hypothetical protein M430DRAFT_45485 [Amorphotheca resinae ATCC 22711]
MDTASDGSVESCPHLNPISSHLSRLSHERDPVPLFRESLATAGGHDIRGIGCCGLGYYLITNQKRFSPYELAGISVGSLALGLGVFDLGRRRGISEGASFALRSGDERKEGEEEEDWRGEFKGREYADLKTEDKVSWLRKEEKKIRDMQAQEKFRCGQAYIAKEEAYAAYEKHGGYGGQDWKNYNQADETCQAMYNEYQRQQKRLGQIRVEINELNELNGS